MFVQLYTAEGKFSWKKVRSHEEEKPGSTQQWLKLLSKVRSQHDQSACMTSCYLSTSELTLYWWCTVVSLTSKYDGPEVENVTRGRSLSATFSTEGHHIWMSREPPCFICFVVWPSSSLKYDFLVNFYRAMLCIRGTSHGPVSVCPSQVGVLSKRLNESSWFLACELHSTRSTLS